jgi:hypothetical protein
MEDKTPIFMDELVRLLIEATLSPNGVPASLIREKELELEKKKQILQEAKELGEKMKKFNQSQTVTTNKRDQRDNGEERDHKGRSNRDDDRGRYREKLTR